MSKFDVAYNIVRKNEGGYIFDPADPGGETYCGISRRSFPSWKGWVIIDRVKTTRRIKRGELLYDAQLEKLVKDFYYQQKYIAFKLDQVNDDGVAALMMDTVTNHGKGALIINKALNNAGFIVTPENVISNQTIAAVNADPAKAYKMIAAQRRAYVQGLPIATKFMDGLLERVDRFIRNDYNFTWVAAAAGSAGLLLLLALFFCLDETKILYHGIL
ncbi:MAG: hypothetical protein EKK37_17325 [Sphingobacteriales bacterium]|nr:MAG: hypothetical protein EKK37_17325 [Sphingobacteriales bacterium]